jgi:hypothetical protein
MKKFLGAALLAAAAACGGGGANVRPGGASGDAPGWLSQGTGAFNAESGKKLQGVGAVSGVSSARARRVQSDAQARSSLQGGIDALGAALAKMSESTKDNAGDEIKAITSKAAAAATHVRDHWVSGDAESALDQLDLGAFKASIAGVDGDDNLKREMANNTDRAFDTLSPK